MIYNMEYSICGFQTAEIWTILSVVEEFRNILSAGALV